MNLAMNCGPLSKRTTQGVPWCFQTEQMSGAFSIDGGMHRDEVCMLGYTVDNVHDCVISMGFRQFDYEVNTNYVPWCIRCL
jgi:hypothetical protein